MSSDAFSQFAENLDPALVVVTACDEDGEVSGCLVGFHAQISIQPPLYAVWLSRENLTTFVARNSEHVAVHYLEDTQRDVASHWGTLTGDATDKFATIAWEKGAHGLPLLTACPSRLILERVSVVDVEQADHVCWVGSVVGVSTAEVGRPLRLSDAADLTAGHEVD